MLIDLGPNKKRCFAYCGDALCDCECAPRYREWNLVSPCKLDTHLADESDIQSVNVDTVQQDQIKIPSG